MKKELRIHHRRLGKKRRNYREWLLGAAVVLLVGGAGCGAESGNSPVPAIQEETQTPEPEQAAEEFEIIGDITMEKDMFSTTLSGVLKNNSGRDYNYLQISFNMYDADGNLVDTAFDNINNLSDGGTWKFSAMGLNSGDAVSCELGEITGW